MDIAICSNCGRHVGNDAACATCPTTPQEHRGSRIPPHMTAIDPLFEDAAFRPFSPDEAAMAKEKREGVA